MFWRSYRCPRHYLFVVLTSVLTWNMSYIHEASILKACHSLPVYLVWCWLLPSMIASTFDWQCPVSCCSICWQQYPCVKQIPLFLWCTPSVLFYMTPLTFFFNFDQHYLINQLVKWSEMSTFTSIIKSLLNLIWRFGYLHKYL